jgi:hypothetical protein
MIILQETGSAQSFSFIPRSSAYNTLQITDEQTGVTTNVTITSSVTGSYYDTITATFSLKQNHFYTLTLKQNTDIVYKDKIFCTNQAIPTFSVNNGQYIVNTSNNDFILYE